MALLLLLLLSFISLVTNKSQIYTTYGPVLGLEKIVRDERNGNNITWTQYSGIPYAAPPIGNLRFRPPQPLDKWSEPRFLDDSELTICPQIILGSLVPRSNEDCLYLNVHVPSNASDHLPVMVWIHGGGFMSGDGTPSSFGPQYFMDLEVIIVTINYRLGPLGYLSLGTEDIPGNMGQLDQVAALQWVQDNIEFFGGDKGRVTLFGQSAGAFASTYHLYSPLSQGLFHRIIAQSGVAGFSPSFHHHQEEDAIRYGNNAALLLGCIIPENRAQCLREKSAYAIQNVEVPEELISQPSIDRSQTQSYLPENPLDLIQMGNFNTDIDIMLGFNEDDGMLITQFFIPAPDIYEVLKELWGFLGPFALFQKHHTEITEEHKVIATEILNHYIDDIGLENLSPDNFWNMTDMFTDSFFTFANNWFLQYHLEHSKGKTFQYRFSYNGEYHRVSAPGLHHDNCPGVIHSDELYFLWNPFYNISYPLHDNDIEMSYQLTNLWTNFAKTGDPNLPNNPNIGITWLPLSQSTKDYLRIGREGDFNMELGNDYLERVSFWEETMLKYNFTFGVN